jgi:PAS domain S-box-containing protein
MYYDEPREPTPADIALTETATFLAANIITGARAVSTLRARTESAERLAAALRESEEQLRSSEERLRAALDASSTSTWRWDMHTNVVEGDDGLFRLFGVDPAEATGSFELFVSLIHPEDRQRVIDAALRCAAEGVELDEEFRIVRPDGSMRWAVDKGKPVLGDDGKPQYLIGACVDVTERRVRDEQFRALAESIPQLAWMADPTGAREWFNQRWYEYTGATPEEARGWGWRKFHHPDHLERVVEGIGRSWAAGEPWEASFPLRGKDGRYRWFLSRAVPIRDADGNVARWFGTSTDINELREAELARDRALAEAKTERQRLYEVFMQAPAAIAVFEGPQHVLTVANELYQEGVGKRDIIGRPVRDALPELVGQGFYELLDKVYASGEPYSARESVVRLDRDGDGVLEDYYVDFVYQPLKDAGGATFGILVHAVDVTVQVRARQEIAAARAEAERANKAKSEFLAAMSHDLRTPLNAIGGYADLIAEGLYGPVNEEQRKAVARIRRAGTHLLTLINDILSFAKIEAGRVDLRIADVPVRETVASAGSMIEVQAAKKGLAFGTRPDPEPLKVRADRERMTQILTNLLTNAVKFTDAGSISVGWRADDRAVRIDVCDTGRGIPADKLASVFEPFVQAGRSAEEQQQGVGLGLAISRELARAMGGDLTVESAVAAGSTFTLRLPRAPDV